MSYVDQKDPYSAASIAGPLIGYALSYVLGANLWLPLLLAAVSIFAISKLRPRLVLWLRYALGLFAGHTLMMGIAVAAQPDVIGQVGVDILIGVVLIGWSLLSASRVALILILIFEGLALGVNIFVMTQLGEWSGQMGGLLVTMLLRLSILVCGGMALVKGPLQFELSAEEEGEIFA